MFVFGKIMAMPIKTLAELEAVRKAKREYFYRNRDKFREYNRLCRERKRTKREEKPVKMTAKKLEAWNDLIGAYHV